MGVSVVFHLRSKVVRVMILWVLCIIGPAPVRAQSGSGQFLHISDIHFNPFYDRSLFKQLDSQPVENWAGILDKSQPPGFNPMGTDSNYALVKSSLDEARRRLPAPDFLLVSGDFMAHDWQTKYDQLATQSHLAGPQEYRAFNAKVIQFLAAEFQQRYPTTPTLPTLGNDDSDCDDYAITQNGPFLKMFAPTWAPLLGPDADRGAFQTAFSQGGHYSMKLPRTKNHRLIVLNSVFFSAKYANTCGTSDQTPAIDELRWLTSALEQAHAAGETVWLLMHIPPGLDSFATAKSVQKNGPAVTLWHPEWTSRFLHLIDQYPGMIQAAFAGHMHRDDFRVIRLNGKPVLFSKLAPAISPVYGNNPGYEIIQYDRQTGAIENYQIDYLTNLSSDGKPTAAAAGSWAIEYDFRETYGYSALNPHTITQLAEGLDTNATFQRNYIKFYTVSAAPMINAQTIDAFRCAILSVTPSEFEACYRGLPMTRLSPPVPDKRPVGVGAPK
jgi:sphingomyelin phosphodiesterase acid-like 3